MIQDNATTPGAEHDHAIGEKDGLGNGVSHEHHRHAAIEKKGLKVIVQVLAGEFVQGGKGFIEEQEARLGDQGPRQGDAHLHATGQLVGKAVQGRAEPHGLDELAGDGLTLGPGDPLQLQWQGDIVQDPAPRQQAGILEDIGLGLGSGGEPDFAPIRAVQPGDQAQRGGDQAAQRPGHPL